MGSCAGWRRAAYAALLVSLSSAARAGPPAAADTTASPGTGTSPSPPPEVVIIGTTPLPGAGVDLDEIPSNVQTIGAGDLDRDNLSDPLTTAASRQMASVNLNNEQGSPYQSDFVYRGFEASPISGVAEGLAVYQNGTRVNEALGDSVNWDLIPQFAVQRMTVQSNNPAFGLNALGGAVTLEMKNGFNSPGGDVDLSGGSFGNTTGYAAYGQRSGPFAFYGAAGGVSDGGFRYLSPTDVRQGYADVGYESGPTTLHLSVSAANNYIGAVGPTPVQMLAANPRSVFTNPQSTENQMQLVQLNGSFRASDTFVVSANVYHRHFLQSIVDGNTTGVQTCVNDASFFCLEGNNLYPADALYDSSGRQVPSSMLAPGATPGEIDYTSTSTSTNGGAVEATLTAPLLGLRNHFAAGASVDDSITQYSAYGQLGTILPSLYVAGSPAIIDQGKSATASPPLEEPVSVQPDTRYAGVYLTDTLSLTGKLAWTLSGRYNLAEIDMHDLLGVSLDGRHSYGHFNPGTGFTYKISPAVTAYAGFSEANRAPTPAELTCANPYSPCLLGAFLVSDPNLRQVVSHTYETGLRGKVSAAVLPGDLRWFFSLYRTDNHNDIILLATDINGFGYFDNVGTTRRQGIETGVSYRYRSLEVKLDYSLVDATYLENLTLASNSPAANGAGNIFVRPGDRIPLTPEHRATADIEYSPTSRWSVGTDARYTSSQYLMGDNSNQEPPLPPYFVVDVHGTYQISKSLEIFASIDNVFDRTYYTYGTFNELGGVPPNLNLTNPRSYSPSPPRTYYGGIRLSF